MIIIQVRANSSRFPGKWKEKINGLTMLETVVDRCMQTNIRPIVVATPDKEIAEYCNQNGITGALFDGNRDDLILRYLTIMRHFKAERCLRVTGDCPFIFPQEMEWVWRNGMMTDFCTNGWPVGRKSYDGSDCEVYSIRLLEWMNRNVKDLFEREHLPLSIYRHEGMYNEMFCTKKLSWPLNLSSIKASIDTPEDIENLKRLGYI